MFWSVFVGTTEAARKRSIPSAPSLLLVEKGRHQPEKLPLSSVPTFPVLCQSIQAARRKLVLFYYPGETQKIVGPLCFRISMGTSTFSQCIKRNSPSPLPFAPFHLSVLLTVQQTNWVSLSVPSLTTCYCNCLTSWTSVVLFRRLIICTALPQKSDFINGGKY